MVIHIAAGWRRISVVGLFGLAAMAWALSTRAQVEAGAASPAVALEAAALQVDALWLSRYAREARHGSFDAFEALRERHDRMEARLERLGDGDPERGIEPPSGEHRVAVEQVARAWDALSAQVVRILDREDIVLGMIDTAESVTALLPLLQAQLDAAVRTLVAAEGTSRAQVYVLARTQVLAERIHRNLRSTLHGKEQDAIRGADSLARDSAALGRSLSALRFGDPEWGVDGLGSRGDILAEPEKLFEALEGQIERVLEATSELMEVADAEANVSLDSAELVARAEALAQTAYRR